MNITWMRKIDYYLGIPLCFACDIARKIAKIRWIFLPKRELVAKRVLFVKLFGIGSIVLAIPAIKRCREVYPEAEIYFLTFAGNRGVFDLLHVIEENRVLVLRTNNLWAFFQDIAKVLGQLWCKRLDVIFDLEFFSRFTAVLSFIALAKYRVGFHNDYTPTLYRGNLLTHQVFYNHYQHTSLAFLDMVECLQIGSELPFNKLVYHDLPQLPKIEYEPCELQECLAKLHLAKDQRLVLVNPNCSSLISLRKWPLNYFAELIIQILSACDDVVVGIIGGGEDRNYCQSLMAEIDSPRISNLAGKTSLQELCLLLDYSSCCITNDTGPAHLAALTSTHIITLFGPETPLLYRPLSCKAINIFLNLGCSPCATVYNGKKSKCQDNQCLKRISSEVVWRHVHDILTK